LDHKTRVQSEDWKAERIAWCGVGKWKGQFNVMSRTVD